MRAVNLIPADQRRASGAAGKSGGGVYFLLGGLAVIVACVAALTLTNKQVADKQATADKLEAQAQDSQAKAGSLSSYKSFNALVAQRTTAVESLAATRFDWGTTFTQVSRVIPSDVSLTDMTATIAPGQGASGNVALRSSLQNPAIELTGCAPSQARVALLMARLRRLEGVERVSVASSGKADNGNASSSSESSTDGPGCQITDEIPQFQMVVFFGTPTATSTAATTTPAGSVKAAIDTINGGTSGTTTTTTKP
jgi:Tfp pilus assembly protein PilN